MTYIATFYTHFGAMNCVRLMKQAGGMHPLLMPVPRKLSSSCGTCVRFEKEDSVQEYAAGMDQEDLDTIYQVEQDEYTPVYQTPRR